MPEHPHQLQKAAGDMPLGDHRPPGKTAPGFPALQVEGNPALTWKEAP